VRYHIDVSKLAGLGWTPKVGFTEGLKKTIDW
jgi:dTDP-D-glucose 4,6-dehydratase